MSNNALDLLTAFGFFCVLLVSLEVGYRSGRRASSTFDPTAASQVGAIQGALLGLLGLLLAFSFAAAGARFLERQDLIVQEANAIGTAYLRTDLLSEQHQSALRSALKDYTAHRVALSKTLVGTFGAVEAEEIDRMHARIWAAASAGVRERPEFAVSVLEPVNSVIDLHSMRVAAQRKHLPGLVMGLLFVSSLLAIAVIGYGCGLGGRRRMGMTAALALLVGSALWLTYDLDNPRSGLLRLSDAPLQSLRFAP